MTRVITIVIGILVICAAVVYWMPAEQRRQYYRTSPVQSGPKLQTVYLARSLLRKGVPLRETDFRKVKWPSHKVPRRAVKKLDGIDQFFARRDLVEGAPLVHSDITRKATRMKPMNGLLAMTLVVDSRLFNEKRLPPGALADLFVLEGRKEEILLEDVRILGVVDEGLITESSSEGQTPEIIRSAKTIELEVNSEQKALIEMEQEKKHLLGFRPARSEKEKRRKSGGKRKGS